MLVIVCLKYMPKVIKNKISINKTRTGQKGEKIDGQNV